MMRKCCNGALQFSVVEAENVDVVVVCKRYGLWYRIVKPNCEDRLKLRVGVEQENLDYLVSHSDCDPRVGLRRSRIP
jgi:hypothetical protein